MVVESFPPDPQASPPADSDRSIPRTAAHTGRLVLTPADPHAIPERGLMIETLTCAGFLGARLDPEGDQAFLIGPGFLSLLAFAGCAVAVRESPAADAPFAHIRIPPSSAHPGLLSGRNTRAPRCQGCRARLGDWRDRAPHWARNHHVGVTCPNCGETRPPWLWDWKRQGGFGCLFVLVEEVFPGEATPTQALFELLIRASGAGWRHFYVQD